MTKELENTNLNKWDTHVRGGHIRILEIKEIKEWNLLIVKGVVCENSLKEIKYWVCNSEGLVDYGDNRKGLSLVKFDANIKKLKDEKEKLEQKIKNLDKLLEQEELNRVSNILNIK